MDITNTSNKIYTTKSFNSETVSFLTANTVAFFIFIVLKQSLKIAFGIDAAISVLISFIVASIISYFFEKKFVFTKEIKNSTSKQLLWLLFRSGVDFGFFKIADFIFSDMLEMKSAFVYSFAFAVFLLFNYQFDKLVVFNSKHKDDGYQSKLYKKVFNNRYIIISAFATFCCFLVIYLVKSTFPFGDTTVLRMDLYHQYGPLFTEFYDRIVNHESFLYSWTSGGGSSFLGNYFNYLSSPLSLIILLFNREEMPFAITTLVAIKGILSATTFSYYLKKSLKSHSFASASFGVLYAFSGYFLAYYWNIMWLDGMILLPIIALGIEKIIDEGKSSLYVASLALLFYCNYYIGFMICIFAVVYFLCYFFIKHSITEKIDTRIDIYEKNTIKYITNNYFIGRGLKFAIGSVLAALLMACVLIPVYFILQSCSATSDLMPANNETYFDIFNFISNHLAGLETTIRSSGEDILPNVYSGIIACLLLPAFIANKEIRTKEKCAYIAVLLFFYASFNNNFLNYFWHAMHFPNDLPYRFSFMYSFILLIVAYKALIHIKALDVKDYAFIGMAWIGIITLCQKFDTNKLSDYSIYISIAFVIILTALLMIIRNNKIDKLIVGVMMIAITFSEVVIADNQALSFQQEYEHYTSNYSTYVDASEHIKQEDKGIYRSELSHLVTRMDPCLYNYDGISTFSSMAYEKYSNKQYSLGMFGNRINSYTYNSQTPVYNMMYSIKYVIDKSDIGMPKGLYDSVYTTQDGCAKVYENRYFLPIAYTVSNDINNLTIEEGNPFEQQSNFITKSTGITDIFIPANYVESKNNMVDCDPVIDNGTYFFSKVNKNSNDGKVEVTVSSKNDSNLYVYIHSPKAKNVNYSWNDDQNSTSQNIETPYIFDLGERKAGEEVKISIDCGSAKEDSSYFEIYAYSVDYDKLDAAYEFLNLGGIDVSNHNDTTIEGTINSGYNGCVYTSIPYDEGWKVYVDDTQVETIKLLDSQLGFSIDEGNHNIRLHYQPKGLIIGSVISATTIIGLIVFNIIKKNRNLSKMNKKVDEDQINILS